MSQPNSNEPSSVFDADPMMAGAQQPMPDQMGAQPMGPAPGMPSPAAPALPKQRFNVYTMMLIISFFALLTASLLLWFELTHYMEDGGGWPPWDTSRVGLLEHVTSVRHLL
ncbi:MAG: hypothetical protein RIC55_00445 [Pirellulaceae bacterium]